MSDYTTSVITSPTAAQETPIMVMLIDDQAIVGEAVRRSLADQPDIDLHYCPSPIECVGQAIHIHPTVILLDLVMPEVDGIKVVQLFRSNPVTANIPIVVLSTTEDPKAKSRAFAAGADDYLVKLPDKIELVARIRYHSKSYQNLLQRDEAYRALRKSQQQLLDSNTALIALNQAFHQAKEDAERANQAKSEFLSRMSHELRTPLNAVLGFGQLLELKDPTPSQRECIDHILKGGRHLLALINEVLDIARVESGRISLSLEPVQLHEVLREATDLVTPLSNDNNIQMRRWTESEFCEYVLADRQRLKQVLINLLSNAIKYNSVGGVVTVSCHNQGPDTVRIAISDSGRGIAEEDIPKLFTPFERLSADQEGIEGTGLGLALSKHLVEAMGGHLGVESIVGEGSVFYIDLPVVQDPMVGLGSTIPEENLKLDNGRPTDEKKVLLIEDNVSNQKLIEAVLSHRPGLTLMAAMQGGMGLELARQHRPDVILLDLHLPDIMGHEVLRRLKESPETSSIPVVIVSADATPSQIERLLDAGAKAYITKPIDVKALLNVLD